MILYIRIDQFAAPSRFLRCEGEEIIIGYDRFGRLSDTKVIHPAIHCRLSAQGEAVLIAFREHTLVNAQKATIREEIPLSAGSRVSLEDHSLIIVPLERGNNHQPINR